MKPGKTKYSSLDRTGIPRLAHQRAWLSDEHLLVVKPGFLSEHYTRFYWQDIQAVLLYPLERPQGWLLAMEVICALTPLTAAAWWWYQRKAPGEGLFVLSILFVVAYGIWRFTRFRWACQIVTKISSARFPLGLSLEAARRAVTRITERVRAVQGSLESVEEPMRHAVNTGRVPSAARKPVFRVHAIVFAIGVLTGAAKWLPNGQTANVVISSVLSVIDGIGLLALFFLQRDFEFPFSVRSAVVFSQLTYVLWNTVVVAAALLGNRSLSSLFGVIRNADTAVGAAQMLFSLYGFAAMYEWFQAQPGSNRAPGSMSGLGLS